MKYVYDMHVAYIQINGMCPDGFFCNEVSARIYNSNPLDVNGCNIEYMGVVYRITDKYISSKEWKDLEIVTCISAGTIDALVKLWSAEFIKWRNKQWTVNNFPKRGTYHTFINN